jgi:hypothetical protein
LQLKYWPLPYVRVKCANCEREGRLSKDGLLERFGDDREMFVVRGKLTEPSCKRENKKAPCLSILPDALLVQAIMAERKEDILDVEVMQEAANYNPKWLEEK